MISPSDLRAIAGAFGLTPWTPRVGYDADAPFTRLVRSLGPSMDAVAAGAWLRGEHQGVPVMVIPHQHDRGFGWESWTAFVAAIDPPLHLGIELYAQSLIDLRDPLGRNDVRIGAAGFDGAVHASAPDHQRLTWFLAPWRPESRDLLVAITRGVARGMRVTDGCVTIAVAGAPTPTPAKEHLDLAVWVARALGARRRETPPTPDEQARAHRWRELARRRRLSFDAERMVLSGEVEGNALELVLEPIPNGAVTATTLTMPGAPPALRVRKRDYRAPWAVDEPDVVSVSPELDAVLVARGDGAPLASEALRQALLAIAAEATELRVDGEQLTFIDGPTAYESELEARITRALAVARALDRTARAPYR